jgi:hypothetical protein
MFGCLVVYQSTVKLLDNKTVDAEFVVCSPLIEQLLREIGKFKGLFGERSSEIVLSLEDVGT